MSNGNPPGDGSLRETLVNRIENRVTHRALIEDERLYLHFRMVLQDLPFDGQPGLLLDEHRAAIATLVDRAARKDIKIFSIVGHASRPGPDSYNQGLSRQRAEAVKTHLLQKVAEHPGLTDLTPFQAIAVRWRGESQATGGPLPDDSELPPEEGDNPLDRRVEIAYRIKIVFPQPADANVPRSRFWKVDFAAGGGTGYGIIGVEAGVGSLTMLPDTEIGQNQTIQKTISYESLGVSVGLVSMLKKFSFLTRFPLVRRLLDTLDADIPGSNNYKHTAELLSNTGFGVDIKSEGGEFYIDEPLSFAEMAHFNFACVAGNFSLAASASGQLILLHSPNFFASTVIYGGGISIAFPDAGLNFVPLAAVDVNI